MADTFACRSERINKLEKTLFIIINRVDVFIDFKRLPWLFLQLSAGTQSRFWFLVEYKI